MARLLTRISLAQIDALARLRSDQGRGLESIEIYVHKSIQVDGVVRIVGIAKDFTVTASRIYPGLGLIRVVARDWIALRYPDDTQPTRRTTTMRPLALLGFARHPAPAPRAPPRDATAAPGKPRARHGTLRPLPARASPRVKPAPDGAGTKPKQEIQT